MPMARRQLLVGMGALGLWGAAATPLGLRTGRPARMPTSGTGGGLDDLQHGRSRARTTNLAIATADEPEALVTKALHALGGMRRFVDPGDVVLVKPNIGFDRTPAHAANTNPVVVAAVVRAALSAGAKRVIVTDRPAYDNERSFDRSLIGASAADAGAQVLRPSRDRFEIARLGQRAIAEWPVSQTVLRASKVINVPVAKHHSKVGFTGATKNWFGVLGGDRHDLHSDLEGAIAGLAAFFRPCLTVIDATRVLLRNGPSGGNLADVTPMRTVIAATDQLAADSCACSLLGTPPRSVSYLQQAAALGAGTQAWETLGPARV